MSNKIYDVIIIGGGPAGLSAAIYARRAMLDTLLIEKNAPGGQILITASIENYPGGIAGESGAEFAARLAEQAKSFGYEEAFGEVARVDFGGRGSGVEIAAPPVAARNDDDGATGGVKKVWVGDTEYAARTVIIATGNVPATLGAPGESEFTGRGVSYCATCDGPFFRGLDVYVVGGGEAAVEEALHLAKIARKVTIIHRRDELRATRQTQHKAKNCGNIEFMFDTVVKEIKGDGLLNALVVENVKTHEQTEIKPQEGDSVMGLFIFVGNRPQTKVFEGALEMQDGYIVTDCDMNTNIKGVYAAGDVRVKDLRQVVTAAADGAIAAVAAEKSLE